MYGIKKDGETIKTANERMRNGEYENDKNDWEKLKKRRMKG
jgi:hypothetical protein